MKNKFLILAVFLTLSLGTSAPAVTFPIDPTTSFLQGNGSSPLVLKLADFGCKPGDQIMLSKTGDFRFAAPQHSTESVSHLRLCFSSSDTILDGGNSHRIPDAIGIGVESPSISPGIPEDFDLNDPLPLTVTIPNGATHLFVGVDDESPYYQDNFDPEDNFKSSINDVAGFVPAAIKTAICVAWQSADETLYQLQHSNDFSAWINLENPIKGDGKEMFVLQRASENRRFYRVLVLE